MRQRILRPGKPAVNVTYEDDYSKAEPTAIVTIHIDGEADCLLTRWEVSGATQPAEAFDAIKRKRLMALMDVLDGFTATLPNMDETDATPQQAAA